jgi:hypothetical protein
MTIRDINLLIEHHKGIKKHAEFVIERLEKEKRRRFLKYFPHLAKEFLYDKLEEYANVT